MRPEAAAAAAFVRAAGAAGLGASRLRSGAGRFYVTCLLPRVGSVPRPAAGQPGGSGPGHLRAARPWDDSLRRAGTRPGLQTRAPGRARLTWRPLGCGPRRGVGVGKLGTARVGSLLG